MYQIGCATTSTMPWVMRLKLYRNDTSATSQSPIAWNSVNITRITKKPVTAVVRFIRKMFWR